MPALTIALDIGNTHIDAGIVDTARLTCLERTRFLTHYGASDDLLDWIGAAISKTTRSCTICSVVHQIREPLELRLTKELSLTPTWVRYHDALPVAVIYKDPQRFGADRLVDLLYAHIAFPQRSAIVIDVGTAVKIDGMHKDGRHIGGVIFPGIMTGLKSLHDHTSVLPLIESLPSDPDFPGTSTESCMIAGSLQGVAGGIERIVRMMKQQLSQDAMVLVTGGGWENVEALVDFEHVVVKDLTLVGTGLYSSCLD